MEGRSFYNCQSIEVLEGISLLGQKRESVWLRKEETHNTGILDNLQGSVQLKF